MKRTDLSHCRVARTSGFVAALWVLAAAACLSLPSRAVAQTAQWIWSPEHTKNRVPHVATYFRKSFDVTFPKSGKIAIAADDRYELFVNGKSVGTGDGWKTSDKYDVSRHLVRGRNVIAVKVTNSAGSTAGLAARLAVRQFDGTELEYATDASWRTSLRPLTFWQNPRYSDRRWARAQAFGPIDTTQPWVDAEKAAAAQAAKQAPPQEERFQVPEAFVVRPVGDPAAVGSIAAMTFNEFGEIVASRTDGPLLLITDSDGDKIPDTTRVLCDKVTGCHGILALNGDLLVVGNGPEGAGLYRLSGADRDGKLEVATTILRFQGEMGRHGAHGVILGPDGYIYLAIGGLARPDIAYAPSSPYRNYYEGALASPEHDGRDNQMATIPAPAGLIVRTDTHGSAVEVIAGGLFNPNDLTFNRWGDLFTHDGTRSVDRGTPWYGPTRIVHLTDGGEFGWRSGSARWPDYYVDSLPATLGSGAGSPTGIVEYDHIMFPSRYHHCLFVCDWERGHILSVKAERSGASYRAEGEVFLEGRDLHATDLEVGPDGALYFSANGEAPSGGIYRVAWKGNVPEALRKIGSGVEGAIRHPQFHSAWARQRIAQLKSQAGDDWDVMVPNVAMTKTNPPHYRTRALDLMQLFGPAPSTALLVKLSEDDRIEIRAKAAYLMGLSEDEQLTERLIALLSDEDATVRRKACESLRRAGAEVPLEKLTALLTSLDRFEAWAARRLLEQTAVDQWRDTVLTTDDQRVFIQGATALLTAHCDRLTALSVIDRTRALVKGYVSDRDFIDMLRVLQLALHRGELTAKDVPRLAGELAEEFPAGEPAINRELIRLLAYLGESSIVDRFVAQFDSDLADADKLHLVLYADMLRDRLTMEQKLTLLKFCEKALSLDNGGSLPGYVRQTLKTLASTLTDAERLEILAGGAQMPETALATLYGLPQQIDAETFQTLTTLDAQTADANRSAARRLRVGIVAVLARDASPQAMEYLRRAYDESPLRRPALAVGLALAPDEANWPYLIRSLPLLEGNAARTVLSQLRTLQRAPKDPEAFRQVILQGLMLEENGGEHALALLEQWTGQTPADKEAPIADQLAAWQAWFAKQYSDHPDAALPEESEQDKWTVHDLLDHLYSEQAAKASPERGRLVFERANCAKCHRHGGSGETMGPDLGTVAKRMHPKRIVTALLHPSYEIAKGYHTQRLLTNQGVSLSGLVTRGAAGEFLVLQRNGQKVSVKTSEVKEVTVDKTSTMPEGLIDSLSAEEIADLMAYLSSKPVPDVAERPADEAPR